MSIKRVRRVRIPAENRRVKVVKTSTQLVFKDPWHIDIDLGDADIIIVVLQAIIRGIMWLFLVPFPAGRRRIKQWKRRVEYPTFAIDLADIRYVTAQTDHEGQLTVTVDLANRHPMVLVARGRAVRRLTELMSQFPTAPVNRIPPGWR